MTNQGDVTYTFKTEPEVKRRNSWVQTWSQPTTTEPKVNAPFSAQMGEERGGVLFLSLTCLFLSWGTTAISYTWSLSVQHVTNTTQPIAFWHFQCGPCLTSVRGD